jgi:ribosomal protein S18 acetylase RimI-like enzyme
MKKIDIIQASLEHVEVLTPLFDGYRQFYKQPSDLEGARRFLSERLANKESIIFLASNENEGLGFIQLYPTFSSIALKRLWILNDLYVLPNARRQGIGKALLDRARQHAATTGAKGLMLETAIDNPAQNLYRLMGYQRDEEFYSYYLNL